MKHLTFTRDFSYRVSDRDTRNIPVGWSGELPSKAAKDAIAGGYAYATEDGPDDVADDAEAALAAETKRADDAEAALAKLKKGGDAALVKRAEDAEKRAEAAEAKVKELEELATQPDAPTSDAPAK